MNKLAPVGRDGGVGPSHPGAALDVRRAPVALLLQHSHSGAVNRDRPGGTSPTVFREGAGQP